MIGNTNTEGFTYNGLGTGSGLDRLLDRLAGLYGITPDTTSPASAFPVTNLIAEPGIDLVPNALAASAISWATASCCLLKKASVRKTTTLAGWPNALAVYESVGQH
ncbi:MAG: hypothetical protein U5P41_02040 [Gammaproteobacteria bacterium]|nr:hypothetical protein [Gammaproteobacteria bacterium]